jgi:hypothetical protein
MTAKLEPAIELPVMMQKTTGTVGTHNKCAPGEMSGKNIAPETVDAGIEQLEHTLAMGLFFLPLRKVQRQQCFLELFARHSVGEIQIADCELRICGSGILIPWNSHKKEISSPGFSLLGTGQNLHRRSRRTQRIGFSAGTVASPWVA